MVFSLSKAEKRAKQLAAKLQATDKQLEDRVTEIVTAQQLAAKLQAMDKQLEVRVAETVAVQQALAEAEEHIKELEAEIVQLKTPYADNNKNNKTSIDAQPAGDEKVYEIKKLITNLSGPIKTRYISVDLVCEGYVSDFEKIMEENDYRIRHAALKVLASYGYEESQQDGFIGRVEIDLRKRFDVVLQKHSEGDNQLISKLFFTEFVIQ